MIKRFDVWIADLNPRVGTEPGKKRPVVVVQTDLLNNLPHASTIICPLTTNVDNKAEILRVHLKKGQAYLQKDCDILIDQIRAIDNRRLTQKIGTLPKNLRTKLMENIAIVIDLD